MGIHAALTGLLSGLQAPITHLRTVNPHVVDVLESARKQGGASYAQLDQL